MHFKNQPIFRAKALEHYIEKREESVLPQFVSPPLFACLWGITVLLVAGAALVSFSKVPVYIAGVAVIASGECSSGASCQTPVVTALLPPESLPRLQVGQTMYLEIEGMTTRARSSVIEVEPALQSPEAIRTKFAVNMSILSSMDHPFAIARAHWEPSNGQNVEAYAGSALRVQVEVGSRRILSILRHPEGKPGE